MTWDVAVKTASGYGRRFDEAQATRRLLLPGAPDCVSAGGLPTYWVNSPSGAVQ